MNSPKRIKYSRGFEIFKDYDQVPIDEVAQSLGIDTSKKFITCPCPDHDDKNPSVMLSKNGKYENSFKCWSCGEHGGPIELVMAVKSGITPSVYFDTLKHGSPSEKAAMLKERDEAVIYLNDLFPGIIEFKDANETFSKDDKLPELPKWILDNYGLPRYFDKPYTVKVRDQKGKEIKETDQLSKKDAAEMVLGKLIELETNLWEMKEKFYELYPHIKEDIGLRMTMDASVKAKIEEVVSYEDKYRDFINNEYKEYDKIQDNTPWKDMSDEDFIKAFKEGTLDEKSKDTPSEISDESEVER